MPRKRTRPRRPDAALTPEQAAHRLATLARGRATQAANRAARAASTPAASRTVAEPICDASGAAANFSPKPSENASVEQAEGSGEKRSERTGENEKGDGVDPGKISAEKSVPETEGEAPGSETPKRDNVPEKPKAPSAPEPPRVSYKRNDKMSAVQVAAMFGPERWSLTEATTKAGKTVCALVWLAEQAILGKAGQNFWWIAPVAPVAAIAYRRMAASMPYAMRTLHDTLQRITLVNGAVIWFKSAEKPDNLYGEDVYAAVIDEASRVREDSWHAVRTTLSATKGKCRMIGNVKGRRNWFFKLCRRAESGATPDSKYHKMTWKDAVAAGILDVAEVEDARSQLPPAVFQELYEAEPSDDTGCPFGTAAIAECVRPMSKNPPVVWGWDFARKRDWMVGIGLDYMGDVCAFERWQMPWQQAIPLCKVKTNRVAALVDSTGIGDVILAALTSGPGNFEGYTFTLRSKQDLMEALAVDIQMRKAHFPEGPIRLELESFEYEFTPNGRGVRYSAPDGEYDDCVCALALARWHWKAGHGGSAAVSGGVGYLRLESNQRSASERGTGNRAILIG